MSDSVQTVFIQDCCRSVPADENPSERLIANGIRGMKTSELLAVIGGISNELAEKILTRFTNLEGVARATPTDLIKIKGIGRRKAAAIHAAFEIGVRLSQTAAADRQMDNPGNVYAFLGEEMRLLQQECVKVILVNVKYRLIGVEEISRGSLDAVMAHPREVFKPAVSRQAYGIILVHNHPSGDPTPSMADHYVTGQIKKAAEILEIKFLDHVILGAPCLREGPPYYSFRENGYL